MIISHSKQFIYLHSLKTAGSSVTVTLARLLRDGDLILGACDDCLKEQVRLPRLPRGAPARLRYLRMNHVRNLVSGALASARESDVEHFLRRYRHVAGSLYAWSSSNACGLHGAHTQASAAKAFLGADRWNSYFKFTFVRNPWDRMVSFYHWRTRGKRNPIGFGDFLAAIASGNESLISRVNGENYSNWPIYTINDRVAVDFVGRFENLNEDLRYVHERIGVAYDGWLPHTKGQFRTPGSSYRSYYTEELASQVEVAFRQEIEQFNYSF